jgi:hypothetical protein
MPSKEIAMAKAKKRVAARKKSSKRGKAKARPVRKMTAKHATPKKAKARVQGASASAKKPAAKRKQSPAMVETRQVAAMLVETTPTDVIDERAPGPVAITEYESVQRATSISTGVASERGEEIIPASTLP